MLMEGSEHHHHFGEGFPSPHPPSMTAADALMSVSGEIHHHDHHHHHDDIPHHEHAHEPSGLFHTDESGLPLEMEEHEFGVSLEESAIPQPTKEKVRVVRPKCEHGRQKTLCADCGGKGLCDHGKKRNNCKECMATRKIVPRRRSVNGMAVGEDPRPRNKTRCEHGRQRYFCKECGGKGICEHGVQRPQCKQCGGKSVCVHGKKKYYCAACGGKGVCEHGKQRTYCKACNGRNYCEHGRDKRRCIDCGGTSLCVHLKRRWACTSCRDLNKSKPALGGPSCVPPALQGHTHTFRHGAYGGSVVPGPMPSHHIPPMPPSSSIQHSVLSVNPYAIPPHLHEHLSHHHDPHPPHTIPRPIGPPAPPTVAALPSIGNVSSPSNMGVSSVSADGLNLMGAPMLSSDPPRADDPFSLSSYRAPSPAPSPPPH
uniref:CR-type domain-containing protein n=1 Tax=Chromera velia CCMP2878 TaxID=1169474 RepID=A0A0G4HK60_9ALVE|eukprot:Cvel_7244.t1-p1 / transcript=Cvel_7244.t1 / gene=Cvel_7244 / organism=Chromera_velia_CCMP2878 / gene_product=hypothetical protein / transcript_product=hypothetical protein / location=Cvel_scaffold373:91919-93190(-) / protein_length=424 / sequence_SO=supercontig / SO=protein_coding / is_pseudo=false